MSTSEKQRVALISLLASAVLALGKLVAGLLTGSLGILSEAVHSVLDFGATIITWIAVRWSDQPPDEEHHYGHAKAESVAALVETGLLFITTAWIVYEAIKRLATGETHVDVTWWAIAIIAGSIIIDFNRSRALSRVAQKTSSEALEADALHFSSDMWSSLVVLVGLGAVWAGVAWADSVAALAVSAFVALAGWRLGKRTLNTLLDAAPEGATVAIRKIIESTDGVLAIERLRIRPAGATLFTSVVVQAARTMPVDDLVALKDELARKIRREFPSADVTVTANPVALDNETVFQKIMLIAGRQQQAIHHLTVQQVGSKMAVSFDLEVDGQMGLGQAHEAATRLENAIRDDLGADIEVESHIEPLPERTLEGEPADLGAANMIETTLRRLGGHELRLSDIHNVRVRRNEEGLFVHYHCRFAPAETVETVHTAIDKIENALQAKYPEVHRVIAHAEPLGRGKHEL
jgi:cation diffusion facilitator family transporter